MTRLTAGTTQAAAEYGGSIGRTFRVGFQDISGNVGDLVRDYPWLIVGIIVVLLLAFFAVRPGAGAR